LKRRMPIFSIKTYYVGSWTYDAYLYQPSWVCGDERIGGLP